MEMKDYYQQLGIARDAEPAAVKKAYRTLARKFHPDVSTEKDAAERMKAINEAYAVLSDPEKRAAYDALSAQPHGGEDFATDAQFGPEHAEFFENLFGRAAHAGRFRSRGEDIHSHIDIALDDAYHGAVRELSIHAPALDQHGKWSNHVHVLNVRIPQGVRQGQHIRLQGQGGPGLGGAAAGDLYLEVRFLPQAGCRVEGRDVYQRLALAPWEAALGAEIGTESPGGPLQVTVPAGSQSGRKLRLKGRGIPGAPAGNLFLVLEVVLPPAVTESQRAVYLAMAREMPFNPRQPVKETT